LSADVARPSDSGAAGLRVLRRHRPAVVAPYHARARRPATRVRYSSGSSTSAAWSAAPSCRVSRSSLPPWSGSTTTRRGLSPEHQPQPPSVRRSWPQPSPATPGRSSRPPPLTAAGGTGCPHLAASPRLWVCLRLDAGTPEWSLVATAALLATQTHSAAAAAATARHSLSLPPLLRRARSRKPGGRRQVKTPVFVRRGLTAGQLGYRGSVWSAPHFWHAAAAPQVHRLFRPPSHAKVVADVSSALRCTLGAAAAAAGRVLTAAK
jgi:hypothetical protein